MCDEIFLFILACDELPCNKTKGIVLQNMFFKNKSCFFHYILQNGSLVSTPQAIQNSNAFI